jgi:hypothetical protein
MSDFLQQHLDEFDEPSDLDYLKDAAKDFEMFIIADKLLDNTALRLTALLAVPNPLHAWLVTKFIDEFPTIKLDFNQLLRWEVNLQTTFIRQDFLGLLTCFLLHLFPAAFNEALESLLDDPVSARRTALRWNHYVQDYILRKGTL